MKLAHLKYLYLLILTVFFYFESALFFLISNSYEEVRIVALNPYVFILNFSMVLLISVIDDIFDYEIDAIKNKNTFPKKVLMIIAAVLAIITLILSYPNLYFVTIPMLFLIYILNNNLMMKKVDFTYIKYANYPLLSLYFFASTSLLMNEAIYIYLGIIFAMSFGAMFMVNRRRLNGLKWLD